MKQLRMWLFLAQVWNILLSLLGGQASKDAVLFAVNTVICRTVIFRHTRSDLFGIPLSALGCQQLISGLGLSKACPKAPFVAVKEVC